MCDIFTSEGGMGALSTNYTQCQLLICTHLPWQMWVEAWIKGYGEGARVVTSCHAMIYVTML